jgi:hypothetical protein
MVLAVLLPVKIPLPAANVEFPPSYRPLSFPSHPLRQQVRLPWHLVDIKGVRFAAGVSAMFNFQVITWSLFGVLLIAYIGVKMSKRKSKQN